MAALPEPDNWQGFDPPRYTPVPDTVFDIWMPRLSGAEFKVLCYICRRTFGWKKDSDTISIAQMSKGIKRRDGSTLDDGTGLAESTVKEAVKGLVDRRLIYRQTNTSTERGDEPTTYSLIIRQNSPVANNRLPRQVKSGPVPGRKDTLTRSRKPAPQETEQQEENEQEGYASQLQERADTGGDSMEQRLEAERRGQAVSERLRKLNGKR